MAEKEKYYMFVDECGDQNLTSLDENFPIFTLCGVLMSHSQLRAMEGRISALKKKYWGDKTAILHSRDIRKCDKEFKILFDLDIKRRFYEDIDALLGEKDAYSIVSCSILKESHIRKFDFLSKKQNVTGLQFADLIAYPITQHLLYPDRVNFAYDIIKDNIGCVDFIARLGRNSHIKSFRFKLENCRSCS